MKYIIATMLALAMLLAACGPDDTSTRSSAHAREAVTTSHAPSTTGALPVSSQANGEAAVWFIDSNNAVSAESKEFTADVVRLGCSGGVTGTVLQPSIHEAPRRW